MTNWDPVRAFCLVMLAPSEVGDCLPFFIYLLDAAVLTNIIANFSKRLVLHLQILSTG